MKHLTLAALALSLAATASADALRDPMRPPMPAGKAPAAHAPAPVLSAVLSVDGARTAIVNGRLVRAGSVVDGYSVEEVLTDGVRMRRAGVLQELRLPQPSTVIKRPAADGARATGGAK